MFIWIYNVSNQYVPRKSLISLSFISLFLCICRIKLHIFYRLTGSSWEWKRCISHSSGPVSMTHSPRWTVQHGRMCRGPLFLGQPALLTSFLIFFHPFHFVVSYCLSFCLPSLLLSHCLILPQHHQGPSAPSPFLPHSRFLPPSHSRIPLSLRCLSQSFNFSYYLSLNIWVLSQMNYVLLGVRSHVYSNCSLAQKGKHSDGVNLKLLSALKSV